ncbi:chemotaxis protein CheA [Arcobacter sp. 31_11_sub10_T18]|nr:chemotaxis protein CheA [Arcobacter sp. 31_11_sub10_T18]
MAGFDISKYREMFVEEAEELFESADNLLLEAENTETLSDEQMGQLFRDVHTLKGSGASVELALFAEFTHDVENLMDKLRNHDIEFIPEMVETLIDGLDVMKELLELEVSEELTRDTFTEMTSELLVDLRAYINGEAVTSTKKEEVTPVETLVSTEKKAFDNFNQISSDKDSNSFGFYDDDLEQKKNSNSYGFFADDQNIMENDDSEAFGFFDDQLQEAAKVAPDLPIRDYEENDDFGFFDDMPDITPESTSDQPITSEVANQPVVQEVKEEAPVQVTTPVAPVKKSVRKPKEEKATSKKSAATNNIRVNLDKIDLLMNNVGDLVITNAMLTQFTTTIEDNKVRSSVLERLELLERHIRDMQDSIMSIRMVPMESIYSKFPKVVRDISKKLGKKIDFKHYGDNVEIDKAMIEGLTDPLMHIVRNSLDHGLETPEDRVRTGKDETGSITMSAEQANGQMIITIKDDGAGIDTDKVVAKCINNGSIDENQAAQMTDNDKAMLIFGAGVSTADAVTDISGRGVGMDVVKTNIHKLGGAIKLDTGLGIGTTITIMLPLTLAILDGLDIAVGEQKYILPLSAIVESLQPTHEMIKKIGDGTQDLLMLREEFIPVVRIHQLFGVEPKHMELEKGMLIVVKSGNSKIAIFIDEFLHQHQVVVKPLDKNFRSVEGVGAATVRGDGSIGLILDILGIIEAQKKIDRNMLESKNAS